MIRVVGRGLRKAYGGRVVLDLSDFEIQPGEFFVLLGPSGSGKTTLLRILAGLARPDEGEVELDGEPALVRPPHERGVGVVFQSLALWPHMSVRGHLALGLKEALPDPQVRRKAIEETARSLGLADHLSKRPAALSGGERQRVALARALIRRPKLLLLDEPFASLDAPLHLEAARLVRDLHSEYGMTTLLITHDGRDASLLADRVGLLRQGRMIEQGAPADLYADPRHAFTAGFLTDAGLLRGTVNRDGRLETALGNLALREPASTGTEGVVAVWPHELRAGSGEPNANVLAREFGAGRWSCRVRWDDGQEGAAVLEEEPVPGTRIHILPPDAPRRLLVDDAPASVRSSEVRA